MYIQANSGHHKKTLEAPDGHWDSPNHIEHLKKLRGRGELRIQMNMMELEEVEPVAFAHVHKNSHGNQGGSSPGTIGQWAQKSGVGIARTPISRVPLEHDFPPISIDICSTILPKIYLHQYINNQYKQSLLRASSLNSVPPGICWVLLLLFLTTFWVWVPGPPHWNPPVFSKSSGPFLISHQWLLSLLKNLKTIFSILSLGSNFSSGIHFKLHDQITIWHWVFIERHS